MDAPAGAASTKRGVMTGWSVAEAQACYSIAHWSNGYFDVDAHGRLRAFPDGKRDGTGIDLGALTTEIRAAGLGLPVLVRLTDILRHRVDNLCAAFADAMRQHAYQSAYTAVYPIKVNQQKSVVETLLAHGGARVGLEAGSKPELMAVLALAPEQGVVICNGYKDSEYVRLALIGRHLGLRVYIVIEKLSELEIVLRQAQELAVTPLLGLRIRLASIGAGKWQNTGGEKSKFGLSAVQVLRVVERLHQAGLSASLQLLHCHLGSQIAHIRDLQRGLRECARYYAELHALNVPIRCVDVGGGLGVDYEGTRSRSFCSMNYSVEEYANNVVHAFWEISQAQGLPQPEIITESGRALTAHHAVLIANVIDHEQAPDGSAATAPNSDDPLILHDLWRGLIQLPQRAALESYHDAVHWREQAEDMYLHGSLSLRQRAQAELLYFAICRALHPRLQGMAHAQREAKDELNERLADKYFLNFSVFQSMPDVWAIDQIFPIVPLQRLNEKPTRRVVIEDLTCDSDGRIDHYVDSEGIETTLPLHDIRAGESYLVGIFLVGAYQEILGDMHNLFGDTDAVNVELTADGAHLLTHVQHGDTVRSVLRYVHFDAEQLLSIYREKAALAPLSAAQRAQFLAELEQGLDGYTYLED